MDSDTSSDSEKENQLSVTDLDDESHKELPTSNITAKRNLSKVFIAFIKFKFN